MQLEVKNSEQSKVEELKVEKLEVETKEKKGLEVEMPTGLEHGMLQFEELEVET